MPFAVLQICIRHEFSEKSLALKYYNNIDNAIKHILDEICLSAVNNNHKSFIIKNKILDPKYKDTLEKYINNNLPIWLPDKKNDGDLLQLLVIEDPFDMILDQSTIGVNSIDDLINIESKTLEDILKL